MQLERVIALCPLLEGIQAVISIFADPTLLEMALLWEDV